MFRQILHAKLHRCTVTRADIDYIGSISIDADLLDAVGIVPYEKVLVANVNNGERFETYVIEAPRGSGTVGLNGASARLASVGDLVLVMAFVYAAEGEKVKPKIAIIGDGNRIEALIEDETQVPGSPSSILSMPN